MHQRTEVRTDYDGSSLPVGVTRTIAKRRSKYSDTPYFCRLAAGKRFYFATASEAASHYAALTLSSASPVAAPPSVSSSGVDLHLNPQSNTGYRCVHRVVRNPPSSRYVVKVSGRHVGSFADVEVAAEAYASLHASVAAHAPASRTALMRPWLLPTWPSVQEGDDLVSSFSDSTGDSLANISSAGLAISSNSSDAAAASSSALTTASTVYRDDSGHAAACDIIAAHGGSAELLSGWSCSPFAQVSGHTGMFVSPAGRRLRYLSSVMLEMGIPPLHQTVLSVGYAVTNHSSTTAASLQQLVDRLSAMPKVVRKTLPKNGPSDTHMHFVPIFQKAPTQFLDPNIGDGKRSSCLGLPVGNGVQWCELGSSIVRGIAADIDLTLATSDGLTVHENSVLRTEPGADDQVGHFDLEVSGPPDASSAPPAIIVVTPLDQDTTLRILPMSSLDRIPTLAEFERLCITVPIRVGQSLLMRYDMAHSGSSAPGLRLHSVLGPPSSGDSEDSSSYTQKVHFLPRRRVS